ncbi:glutamate 5-kinase [Synechococcus sp. R55.6]|jgi:glutamate 5-kinase (EC 2.7.2.11)|uniref:Glutamate 5-kinase n=1 Tax=Synechococcus sp. (strain JA-2-3B'a(2-13)) TaxID=321332 RepID=PROB_SYNJB|nr:glutamate 5-kinase [Synechococcus sp. JA-2-3B'a(2-13)]Q2JNZ0.2 RecName: Full=Glutamate 5-kinase; AltName: Full=Gamma-glutamyl kinase; Short=GK [Synechococcus sp. JA-2-3B'a(2-13)]
MATTDVTVVVKIGTSSLTDTQTGLLRLSVLGPLVEVLTHLRRQGYAVILVSSGAVGVGCARLGWRQRPTAIAEKQAVAAVGQGRLIRLYDDLFSALNQPIAQVLLTRGDLVERSRYVNANRTFAQLLQMGVIPIVNENDTVAVEELKFGDNDSLSALVASMVQAKWLILLTDVDKLYSADPNRDPSAQPIERVLPGIPLQVKAEAQGKSGWGTGGMATKLTAAQIATAAGVTVVITNGKRPEQIPAILAGEAIGTRFDPAPQPASARKRWIAYGLIPEGSLTLDEGAVRAVCEQGRSLLPAGITAISGEFEAGAAVRLCDPSGQEVARGLVNYSAEELRQIKGKKTAEIPRILGYEGVDTAVHRDNLALLN